MLAVFLAVVLTVAQLGLWLYAASVAQGAAREGALVAALEGGTPDEGAATARRLLGVGLGGYAAGLRVAAEADAEVAVVAADGTLAAWFPLPGLGSDLPVHARAVARREGFRP